MFFLLVLLFLGSKTDTLKIKMLSQGTLPKIRYFSSDVFSLEDQTMLQFNYQFDSSHCNFDIVDNALSFSTKVDITIQPSEVKMLDCILHSRCQHHPQLTVHDTKHIQIAPEIFHNPLLNISSVSIFNSSSTEQSNQEHHFLASNFKTSPVLLPFMTKFRKY